MQVESKRLKVRLDVTVIEDSVDGAQDGDLSRSRGKELMSTHSGSQGLVAEADRHSLCYILYAGIPGLPLVWMRVSVCVFVCVCVYVRVYV